MDIIYSHVHQVFLSARHEEAHNDLTTKYTLDTKGEKENVKLAQFLEFFLHLYQLSIGIKMSNSALL